MPKKEILTIGGQAVIEGVMMRSKTKAAVACRTAKGKIVTKDYPLNYGPVRTRLVKIPIVRGVIMMGETLSLGFKAIQYSSSVASGEDEDLTGWQMGLLILISSAFAIGLFVLAPLFITNLVHKEHGVLFNLIEGALRIIVFVIYLLFIAQFEDIKTLFRYHGGEHMTVAAHEAGAPLNVKSIRKYSRLHPRCGTAFLLIVLLVSILAFSVLPDLPFLQKLGSRIILIPLIAGFSYELLKLGGRYPKSPFMAITVWPGLLMQRITTAEPTDKQIEVAIAALKRALK